MHYFLGVPFTIFIVYCYTPAGKRLRRLNGLLLETGYGSIYYVVNDWDSLLLLLLIVLLRW